MTQFFMLLIILISFNFSYSEKVKILKNPIEIKSVQQNKDETGQHHFELRIKVAENHFLYLNQLSIISEFNKQNNSVFDVEASPAIEFKDKFSNYELKKAIKDNGTLKFTVPYNFNFKSHFKLSYQACTSEFCYLPKTLDFDHGLNSSIKDNNSKSKIQLLSYSLDFDSSSMLFVFILVFLAGILTSFTPCIFPMIPITLTLIQNNIKHGRLKAFQKTFVFVLGIAFTYSILGLIAASTGAFFGSFLSHPYVLIGIGVFYFVMAASILGFFEVQFFGKLQQRFSNVATESNLGVFLFGLVTGIFASPCVGPVLIGILTYAAKSKDLVFSFFLLFIYAFGIGQIFLVLSLFSNLIQKLPKSGQWLNGIKIILALLLVLAGFYFILPGVKNLKPTTNINYSELIESSIQKNKFVIVDFKADWCGACKELENKTFKSPEVKKFLDENIFLAIDVTVTTEETSALLEKYKVLGLPHVIFFDKNGQQITDLTISSYIDSKEMMNRVESLKAIDSAAK